MRDDPWLAERLGRAALWWQEGDDPTLVADAACERAPALAQARVPAEAVLTLGELQSAGFRVVDATVTMAGCPQRAATHDGIEVRDATPGDAPALLEVAEHHYGVSRFHLDPAIDDELAGSIKRRWLQAYFDGERGDRLLVAQADGRPAGFLALLRRDDRVGVIDLVAVHPDARGRGAGGALVRASAPAFDHIEAGTQLANTGALRFYASLGFTVDLDRVRVAPAYMRIGRVDTTDRVAIVAELGNNHEGDITCARELVHAAAAAGAHAVKLQFIDPPRFVRPTQRARMAQLERFLLTPEQHAELAELARTLDIGYLCTPFDLGAIAWLAPLVDALKISSGDNDFHPLIRRAAASGRPLIISTGMSNDDLD